MTLETIHIYHTNDIHSHLEHWPRIAHFIKQQRKRHELKDEDMLLFDIGDHCDRVDSLTEGLQGKGNITLLNELQYDNVTIGNNEGITFSKQDLNSLYDEANFEVLVANLFHKNGQRPHWAFPYDIHRLNNGLTVGVIGVTVPFYAFYDLLGWQVLDPWEVLPPLIQQLRKKVDIVILLSHMGYGFDVEVANTLKGIDVIIGAHTHHLLQKGKRVKGTLITQAGKFGHYVGQITLTFDRDIKQIVSAEASCVPVTTMKKDEPTERLIQRLRSEGKQKLNEAVTKLDDPLPVSWYESSPFAELLVSSLKEWCKTDIAMVNAGILLDGLPAGVVTKSDLHRVCPHPINPVIVTLTGSELREIIAQALRTEMIGLKFQGLGFRGEMMGAMIYDGVEFDIVRFPDGENRARNIEINGKPLESKANYEVATIDMFTFGRFYPAVTQAKDKRYFLPEMLRDLLAWKLSHIMST